MASTYSDLKIELIGTGEQSGTWGATTNLNLGDYAIGEAITGSANVTFASADVTVTLTNTNATQTARNLRLNLIGTTGGARNLILGSDCQINKQYIVNNACADAITVKNTTGTGISVPAGKSMILFNNGTNVVEAITFTNAVVYPGAGIANSTGTAWGTSYTTSGSGTVVALATNASLTTPTINTAASVGGTWTAAAAWTIPTYTVTGNIVINSTGATIQGDFSNATIASRNAFKSSTTNGSTVVGALPNGTATGSAFQAYNNATPTNASLISLEASSTSTAVASTIRGSGTYLPLYFYTNNTLNAQLSTAGVFSVTGSISSTRVNPRSLAAASATGTVTPDSNTYDQVNYLLTGTVAFAVPSGTPVNGQKLSIRLYAASTQTVSWTTTSTGYREIGTILPFSVAAGKTVYVGCVWNSTDSFWDVVAVATQV